MSTIGNQVAQLANVDTTVSSRAAQLRAFASALMKPLKTCGLLAPGRAAEILA